MKTATTPYSISVQKEMQINRTFLLSQGWVLKDDYPLFETFQHSKDTNLHCSIGLYGEFSIDKLHWCNQTPEYTFSTLNPKLTQEDYFKIISLLNISSIELPSVQVSDTTGAE